MEKQRLQFSTIISNVERINPEFAKVKIHIMYDGLNRNGSFFKRQTIEDMLPTIKNIPVVGEWKEENDNFGGHGGKVEITDKEVKYIDTTVPYGVVPSDTEITWERIREKDGITEHDYLTCFAYLWVGRYPVLEKVLNDGANQSMEIGVDSYHYNDEGYMEIDNAYFSALCILGKDDDADKNYEPCFEGANIQSYYLNKEQFITEFNLMINELKNTLIKGGAEMGEEQKEFEVNEDVQKEVTETSEVEEVNENFEVTQVEDTQVTEEVHEVVEEVSVTEENKVEEFASNTEVSEQEENKDKQIFNLNSELNNLRIDYSNLLVEIQELREYKRQNETKKELTEKEELFTKYSIGLSEEEMKPVRDKIDELSLSEIRVQLNEIFTNKNLAELKSKKVTTEVKTEEFIQSDIIRKSNTKSRYAV